MSLLVIQLPPRDRMHAVTPGATAPSPLRLPARWAYTFSADGQAALPLRRAAAKDMPKADEVALVVAAPDISWHRVLLPKANAARMRAALAGVLEEHILEDDESVHLALAADAQAGQNSWVAATHGPRLKAALAALAAGGVQVQRVVPAMPPPGSPLRAHFSTETRGGTDDEEGGSEAAQAGAGPSAADVPCWSLSTANGSWHLPLRKGPEGSAISSLAIAMRDELPQAAPDQQWTTTPAAALVARRFMGRPIHLQTDEAHLLEAAQSPVNLRQFDLQQGSRGFRMAGDMARRLQGREWRAVHVGLAAMLGLHIVGLNVYAWKQNQGLQARRAEATQLLRTAFPTIKTVLDAPAQMRSEVERLRVAAGQPGPGDLEVALTSVAAAWPEGKAPVGTLRFQSQQLSLAAPDWREDEVAGFRTRLGAAGWNVSYADGVVTVAHGRSAKEAP